MKWEYKIGFLPRAAGEADLIGWLNFLGQEGWELIHYDTRWAEDDSDLIDIKGIFKRKIQEDERGK